MNLDKLTPAPWTWRVHEEDTNHKGPLCGLDGKILLSPTNEGDIAINDADAEFIVLARNAFDVMMRRGWYPVPRSEGRWSVTHQRAGCVGFKGLPSCFIGPWPDPFTALVEADKWYRENVEERNAKEEQP